MLPVLSADALRTCDRRAMDECGVRGITLMERAASGTLAVVRRAIPKPRGAVVLVVCGRGNNGGDGFAVARLLRGSGYHVSVLLAALPSVLTGDALVNFKRCQQLRIPVETASEELIRTSPAVVIIDALLGTGARLPLDDGTRALVRAINHHGAPVVAIDLPTGVGADGECDIEIVHAVATATIGALKPGLLFGRGRAAAGGITVVDLPYPDAIDLRAVAVAEMVQAADVRSAFRIPTPDASKYSQGSLFLLCGSPGMLGAGILASRAALRAGVGYARLSVPEELFTAASAQIVECLVHRRSHDEGEVWVNDALEQITIGNAAVVGSGLGREHHILKSVRDVVLRADESIVLDADGIVAFAGMARKIRDAQASIVLTPHAGELSTLIGVPRDEIERDPIAAAVRAADETGQVVVLKGGPTVIAQSSFVPLINPTGNAGMATAGSGDVLAGVIGALLAQGIAPRDAATAGVFVHGLAGDLAADALGMRALNAGDIIGYLPSALRALGVHGERGAWELPSGIGER
jgi:hydroxyethylthiazole kinase-like uncharacterized protein yjeF